MKIRLGVDIACRSAHHAACADETGALLWSGQRFRTDVDELEALWARLPVDVEQVMVVMEPTRNAWVPLAAWFRRQGAVVVLVPSEQSSDLRDYLPSTPRPIASTPRCWRVCPCFTPRGCIWPRHSARATR